MGEAGRDFGFLVVGVWADLRCDRTKQGLALVSGGLWVLGVAGLEIGHP